MQTARHTHGSNSPEIGLAWSHENTVNNRVLFIDINIFTVQSDVDVLSAQDDQTSIDEASVNLDVDLLPHEQGGS